MDLPMELDFDNEDNTDEALKQYVRGKIKDTELLSKISEKKLNEVDKHREQCLELLKNSEKFDSSDLSVINTWQRIYNKKWIIGVNVENLTLRPAKNINIILHWDNKNQDLLYSIKIYSKYKSKVCEEQKLLRKTPNPELLKLLDNINDEILNSTQNPVEDEFVLSQDIQNCSTIIIFLDIPEFIQCNQIKIQGILTYEKIDQKHQKPLPNFILKVSEILSNQFTLKMGKVIKGSEEEFLSVLSTGKFTPVKLVLPEGIYRTLEGIVQIDCFFTKIEVKSKDLFVVFDGVSDILMYSCLKLLEGQNNVILITQNDEQLYMLYHHLYNKIPGVIILDENSEQINDNIMFTRPTQSYLEPLLPNQENLKEFVDSFEKQLIFLENNLKESADSTKKKLKKIDLCKVEGGYINFRKNLAELEYQTDKLFLQVFDNK